jgi:hypothetical protein
MKKPAVLILASLFSFCLSIAKKENNEENIKEDFSALTKSYFDGKMR